MNHNDLIQQIKRMKNTIRQLKIENARLKELARKRK